MSERDSTSDDKVETSFIVDECDGDLATGEVHASGEISAGGRCGELYEAWLERGTNLQAGRVERVACGGRAIGERIVVELDADVICGEGQARVTRATSCSTALLRTLSGADAHETDGA